MRENGVDSPYLFLHPDFCIVASLAHTIDKLEREIGNVKQKFEIGAFLSHD